MPPPPPEPGAARLPLAPPGALRCPSPRGRAAEYKRPLRSAVGSASAARPAPRCAAPRSSLRAPAPPRPAATGMGAGEKLPSAPPGRGSVLGCLGGAYHKDPQNKIIFKRKSPVAEYAHSAATGERSVSARGSASAVLGIGKCCEEGSWLWGQTSPGGSVVRGVGGSQAGHGAWKQREHPSNGRYKDICLH